MDVPIDHGPIGSAKELVRHALANTRPGQTVSVKETIAAIRKRAPDLAEPDLVELVMREVISYGAFVAFDMNE
ncbi:MAG: hypothetical protein E5W55_01080 [Mesorhizobium sp.]|nr:MAG: hypothetical protein E5W55_01080 [Mesorhizobium sp.]